MPLSWLYPRYCELCHRHGDAELCPECMDKLPRLPLPICLHCGNPVDGGQPDAFSCPQCWGRDLCFDFARSYCSRTKESVQLIYQLKYHRGNYLALPLAKLLSRLWDDEPELASAPRGSWCLVPVPSEREHLLKRGFNQAEELARMLGKLRGLPVLSPLIRRKTDVGSQTHLSAGARKRNALHAYALAPAYEREKKSLPAPNVVLIDDVYTTGATSHACSRLLKRLPGVRRVGVLTVLRVGKHETT